MIWSSAHDLVEFGIFHNKARLGSQEAILSDASIDAMQTPGTGAAAHYGIGWNITEAHGRKVIAHGGDMEGTGSLLLILPSEELVVAAICNRRADPGPVVDDILEVILPGWKNHPPHLRCPIRMLYRRDLSGNGSERSQLIRGKKLLSWTSPQTEQVAQRWASSLSGFYGGYRPMECV